eukprot:m.25627 g.25627  ORF g.25627 m.25627 type:complete len:465 (+) comp5784_c0_seq2:125-1519(+)
MGTGNILSAPQSPRGSERVSLIGRGNLHSQRVHLETFSILPPPVEVWIEDKKKRDQEVCAFSKDLWLVHGILYDLSSYMDKHPGGKEWLELMRGSDCTTEFETHHPDMDKVKKILNKYKVGQVDEKAYASLQPYHWDDPNAFYPTIRKRANELLKKHGGNGPTHAMLFISYLAVIIFGITFALTAITGSFQWSIATGYMMFVLIGVGHNFFHQRNHILRFASDFTLAGHHQWRLSHCISHHTYPNQDVDYEASTLEPYDTFMRSQTGQSIFFFPLTFIVYCIVPCMDIVRNAFFTLKGDISFRWEHALRYVEIAVLLYAQGWWHGLLLFVAMNAVSMWLLIFLSFPVHRTEYAWTDGCQAVEGDHLDFGEHILASTHDFNVPMKLLGSLFIGGTFSNHIVHHMFPTVDLSKQHLLNKLLEDTCVEYKVQYRQRSFWNLFLSMWKMHYRFESEGLKYKPQADLLH